jgi:hypothetical protein
MFSAASLNTKWLEREEKLNNGEWTIFSINIEVKYKNPFLLPHSTARIGLVGDICEEHSSSEH